MEIWKINRIWLISLLIFFALTVRLFPIDFPDFTSDEARIAYRGYTLSKTGRDELGRPFPLIFNSLDDYQLPVTSYLTAMGVLIFGKTDLGARVLFILIGTMIAFLIYKISKFFLENESLSFYAAVIACLSPGLIFFSKFPNEFIVATFLTLVLITQILKDKINIYRILIVVLLMILTSKVLWFTLLPVLLLSIILNNKIEKRERVILFVLGLIPTLIAIFFYLHIPQGTRSLIENNFAIVNDVTVKNGIERLRGQQASQWPIFLDRILFNKIYLIAVSIFHWFSQFGPSRLFAEMDHTGNFGFLEVGAFPKALIIPFVTGLLVLIKENKRTKFLLLYIIFVTFPLIFLYPTEKVGLILPALPFIALISALGYKVFSRKITVVLFIFLVLELIINSLFTQASIKNSNGYRQGWIKKVIDEAITDSSKYNIAFSDDITKDMVPSIEWYTNFNPKDGYEDVKYPYKFRQTRISDITLIGAENTFYNCGFDKPTYIYATKRDFNKIRRDIKVIPEKSYQDYLGNDVVYALPPKICVH